MTDVYKADWDRTTERFRAFWERELVDRCCIGVKARKDGADAPPAWVEPQTLDELERFWLDPEWNLAQMTAHFGRTFYGGEAYPATTMCLGASVMAEFLGARAELRPDTVWYHAVIDDPDGFDWDTDPTGTPLYRATFDATRCYAAECRGRYWVGLPELGSATDDFSLLRGMQDLLYDMLDRPEWVKRGIGRLVEVWSDTHRKLYEIARPCTSDGCCIPWMGTWAPGPHFQLSCDFSAILSPAMFREFIVPELEAYLDVSPYGVYHLDGPDAVKHLDALLELPRLKAIQWTQGDGQAPKSDPCWLPMYRHIQDAGKCLILPGVEPAEVEPLMAALSSRGLFMTTWLPTEGEARSLLARVPGWTRDDPRTSTP